MLQENGWYFLVEQFFLKIGVEKLIITCEYKATNCRDEAREEGVERESANEDHVDELDDSREADVGEEHVDDLEFFGCAPLVLLPEVPANVLQ